MKKLAKYHNFINKLQWSEGTDLFVNAIVTKPAAERNPLRLPQIVVLAFPVGNSQGLSSKLRANGEMGDQARHE